MLGAKYTLPHCHHHLEDRGRHAWGRRAGNLLRRRATPRQAQSANWPPWIKCPKQRGANLPNRPRAHASVKARVVCWRVPRCRTQTILVNAASTPTLRQSDQGGAAARRQCSCRDADTNQYINAINKKNATPRRRCERTAARGHSRHAHVSQQRRAEAARRPGECFGRIH